MNEHIKLFETHSDYEEYINSQNKILPNVSFCKDQEEVHYNEKYDYSQDYLTFVALEDGTFTFTPQNNNVISYSIDNGENWITGNSVQVNNGNKVLWKGTMTPESRKGIGSFSSTCNFNVQGNIMSLLYGDNYQEQVDLTGKKYAFYALFQDNLNIINAENLLLPATTLGNYCYSGLFYRCTNLVTAPELPAMTLSIQCYSSMFDGCTSLTIAPELPATILVDQCYGFMFRNCSSLTTAPILPAKVLTESCYYNMFKNCINLNYIQCLATNISKSSSTNDWVEGVAATGIFVKDTSMSNWTTGTSGIPAGWTVQTASE